MRQNLEYDLLIVNNYLRDYVMEILNKTQNLV